MTRWNGMRDVCGAASAVGTGGTPGKMADDDKEKRSSMDDANVLPLESNRSYTDFPRKTGKSTP